MMGMGMRWARCSGHAGDTVGTQWGCTSHTPSTARHSTAQQAVGTHGGTSPPHPLHSVGLLCAAHSSGSRSGYPEHRCGGIWENTHTASRRCVPPR